MKKIITIILFLMPLFLMAQTVPPIVQGSKLYEFRNGLRIDSAFFIPRKDTLFFDNSMKAPGMITWRPADSTFYVYRGNRWLSIVSSAGAGLSIDSVRRSNDTLFFRYTTGGELAVKVPAGSLQQVTDIGNTTPNEIVLTGADSIRDVDGLHLLKNTFWSGNLYRGTKDYLTMQMSDFVLGASGQANYNAHNMLFTSDSLIRLQAGKGIIFYTSDGVTPATINTRFSGVDAKFANEFVTKQQAIDSLTSSLRDSLIRNQFSYEQNANAWIKDFQAARIGIGRASAPYRLFDVYNNKSLLAWDGKTLIVSSDTAIGLNTNIGYQAGVGNNGLQNVYVGSSSGLSAVGSNNTAAGYAAGYTVKGDRNTFVGWETGGNTDSSDNVMVGFSSMLNVNGYNNSSLGSSILIDSTIYLSSDTIRTSDLLSNSYTGAIIAGRISTLQLHHNTTYAIKTTWLNTPPTTSLGNSAFVKVRVDTINGKLVGINSFPGIDTGFGRIVVNIIPHRVNVSAIGYKAVIDSNNQVVLGNSNVTQIKSGKIRISVDDNPGSGDVLSWNGNEYVPAAISGISINTVTDIAALVAYSSPSPVLIVKDTDRGGVFYYTTTTSTIDNGIVFPATGRGSGYWVRQYNPGLGVNVDWWGSDSYAILAAVNFSPVNGKINFTSGKTYLQYDAILPKTGQYFNGNKAILKRAPEVTTTLSSPSALNSNVINVTAIPGTWKIGDYLQVYYDSTAAGSIRFFRAITNITGTTITLSDTLGTNESAYDAGGHPPISSWPASTSYVRKVFSQFTSAPYPQDGTLNWYIFTQPNYYTIENLIFDGNRFNNSGNLYWAVNSAVFNMGFQTKIKGCEFYNIPNDCINGHGFYVENCIAKYTNASFVHLSANDTTYPKQIPTEVVNNYTDSTNLRPTAIVNGHSRGTIEFSLCGGHITITNNRFYNGGTTGSGVFGYFVYSLSSASTGSRDVIITGNYAKNYPVISHSNGISTTTTPYGRIGHILIDGNVFDNCGNTNNWSALNSQAAYLDTVRIGSNLLVGGTTWTVPNSPADGNVRYIYNSSSTGTTSQLASINISSTTANQFRVGYNDANYLNTNISSAGLATITATGTTPSIALANNTAIAGTVTATTTAGSQITSAYDGSNKWTTSTGSTGLTQVTATGSSAGTQFNQVAYFNGNLTTSSSGVSVANFSSYGLGAGTGNISTAGLLFGGASHVAVKTWFNGTTSTVATANDNISSVIIGDGAWTTAGSGFHAFASNIVAKRPNITIGTAQIGYGAPIIIDDSTNYAQHNSGLIIRKGALRMLGGRIFLNLTPHGNAATDSIQVKMAGDSAGGVIAVNELALNASQITAGTLPIARGGTGVTSLGNPGAGKVLTDSTGAGIPVWRTPSTSDNNIPLKDVYTAQGNSSSTPNNYTALHTFNVSANTLTANGQKILMTSGGDYSATVGTKDLQVFINGNGCGTFLSSSVSDGWQVDVFFIRTGTTTGRVVVRTTAGTALSDAITTDLTGLDYTGAITFAVWGASGTGTVNDVTAKLTRWVFEQAAP